MKFLSIILLFSTICNADVNIKQQDSIQLEIGASAPFTGFLLPPDKILQFRNDEIDLSFYKKTNDNLNLEITDYENRIKNYQDQNDSLAKQVASGDTLGKIGWFLGGAIITGLLAQAIYRTR